MEGKFVRLGTGTTKVLFVRLDGEAQLDHWIAGRPILCVGKTCKYCESHIGTRERYNLQVKFGDELQVLSVPPVAYRALQKEFDRTETAAPVYVAVQVVGTGANTRYGFAVLGQAPGHPLTAEPESEEAAAITLPLIDKEIVNTLRWL
ncbi:hypothetical protein LCGC14_1931620 [marine sediment metagenome]|uniref:Uncharacterized protein n=1 Tax=marine sediment metagenome TaxID=412755 RepID=A0A0F9I1S2_9ZZZZ